jgi:hypothetical protein
MDQSMKFIYEKRAEKAIKHLKLNRMDARYFENKEQLIEALKEMLPKGAKIGCGGSMTLVETGVMNLIKSGDYQYIEREGKDLATRRRKIQQAQGSILCRLPVHEFQRRNGRRHAL